MSFFDDPPLHDFPDRAIRLLQAHPAHLRELVEAVAPELAPLLDFDRVESLDRAFLLPDWRRRESDLLFLVPFRSGQAAEAALVCVLVEHQSDADPAMPLRTLSYAVLFWERQWRAWQEQHDRGDPLRLVPVLPIVLHTGQRPWTAHRRLVDLMSGPPELKKLVPDWAPIFWDLAERTPAELLQMAGDWLPTLAVVRAEDETPEHFQAVFAEALRRLEPLSDRERVRWHNLLWFVLSWGLRRRDKTENNSLYAIALASQQQVAMNQEVAKMSQMVKETWDQVKLEEGRKIGRAEGRAEGREEGRAEGRATGFREALFLHGRKLFGEPDAGTRAALEAITDRDRLEKLFDHLLTARSWQELLASP